jgi:Zn-dependent M28 family amino/carboxypeptidase
MGTKKFNLWVIGVLLVGLGLAGMGWISYATINAYSHNNSNTPVKFNKPRATKDTNFQTNLGPRTIGSQAHEQTKLWIIQNLKEAGWETSVQETQTPQPIANIIGKWGKSGPIIIIGAHYDSRFVADKDPDPARRAFPVPGANDGASGVAVLLEMARVLPQVAHQMQQERQIWLVFFDTEDNGNIPGWDWILGSQAFVQELLSLNVHPEAAVVIDMIGDADLNIYQESNSDPGLTQEIWNQAARSGYSKYFLPMQKYNILDDHIPFLNAGIPAVDIIDFDYPYWHTTEDTADKVSGDSLEAVGDTLINWILQKP